MQEQMTALQEENKLAKSSLEEKTKREKELETVNQSMFLKLTTQTKEKQEEEFDTEAELKEYFDNDDVYELLSKKDKENLTIIYEGEDE